MGMKRILFILSAIALLAVSCTKESKEKPEGGLVPATFNATLTPFGEQTKATLQTDGKVVWANGDKIAVYDGYEMREFTLASGSGTANAVFKGEVEKNAKSFEGTYPYSAAFVKSTTPDISEQKILSGQLVDPAALTSKAEAVAKDGTMNFKPCVGLLKFTASAATEIVFSGKLSGKEDRSYKISCPSGGSFFAAVMPGEYSGASVISGNRRKTFESGLTIKANQFLNIGKVSDWSQTVTIKDCAELNAFLANPSGNASLTADIDASAGITPAATFAATLDGCGHIIKNWTSSKGLVGSNSGAIRNLTIDKSCSFTPSAEDFAPFANSNSGILENLVNEAKITVSDAALSSKENIAIAGIAARSEKELVKCVNKGEIVYAATGETRGLYLGGVVGMTKAGLSACDNDGDITYTVSGGYRTTLFGGIAAYCAGPMVKCRNTGNLAMSAGYLAKCVPMEIYDGTNSFSLASLIMGGVVGGGASKTASTSDFSAEDCINNGSISFALTDPVASGCETVNTKTRHCIGGLVGDGSGPISGSVAGSSLNNGDITVSLTCTAGTFTYNGGALTTYIGGIAGAGYLYKAQNGMDITNCENLGKISYTDQNTQTTSHTVGGIVGWPGSESTCTSSTAYCTNNGNITINTNAELRAAGIQGGSGKVDCCTNNGDINVVKATKSAQVGGIVGFHSNGYLLNGVVNRGDIRCDEVVSEGGVGAIAGKLGNSAMTICANSAVNCKMTVANGCSAGMVIGGFNGSTKAITCGNVAIRGSFNGTTLTETNFRDYLHGTYNYSADKHTINATFGDAPEPVSATVKIMSFNIRHTGEASDTGDKNWEVRKTAVLKMILEEMPDLLGVQECDKTQKDWLMEQIEGEGHDYYKHVYPGGNKCIFYKLSTMGYTSGTSGLFYHSDTPDVSSKWEGMTSSRVTAWIPVVEKTTGKAIYYFNTHTDASSGDIHDAIRVKEAELNVKMAKKLSSPSAVVIISGDMNTAKPEAHAPFSPYFVSSRTAPETDNYPTFNGFGKYDLTTGEYLDYIYVHNASKLIRHRTLVGEGYGVKYISDHWPVVLEFEVK